jgi:peptidoglycan/LPS O-acetylase OafA/YrhL
MGAAPLGVTWSVALEEQFYLFLPRWIRLIPARWLPVSFLGLAAVEPIFARSLPWLTHLFWCRVRVKRCSLVRGWLGLSNINPGFFKSGVWCKGMLGLLALGAIGMVLLVAERDFGVFSISVISAFWVSFLWLVLAFMGTP